MLGFCDLLGTQFRDQVINRKGRIVVRPDSGDPVSIVLQVLDRLGKYFPPTINGKGFKVLPDYIRILQGDGINYHTIIAILEAMKNAGWAAENIIFGCGGRLLQFHSRDSFGMAIKCSSCVIDGEERDVFKDPITQTGKRSKKGRLGLLLNDDGFVTVSEDRAAAGGDHLRVVFENGEVIDPESFNTIRERADGWFKASVPQAQGVGH